MRTSTRIIITKTKTETETTMKTTRKCRENISKNAQEWNGKENRFSSLNRIG